MKAREKVTRERRRKVKGEKTNREGGKIIKYT
jgi:hypothetical protein